MRLATLHTGNEARVVAVNNGGYFDLHAADPQLPRQMIDLLALEGGLLRAEAAAIESQNDGRRVMGQLLAPIPRPGKVICIGLNYRDHAAESGMAPPTEPIVFSKFSHAVIGPDVAVRLPAACLQVDYEAELVAVIGKRVRRATLTEATAAIAGYTVGNDVSARDWQLYRPGKQWLMGKTADTFAPIGPHLVTADEIPDHRKLSIKLRLNGTVMQDSSTSELIFGVPEIIVHLSQIMTLEPGDIIFTGTPPGVGMARNPPVWIKPGDHMEVEIERVGVLCNPVVADE